MSGASEESRWYQSEFARQLAREEQQQQAREEQQQQVREKQREKSWVQLEMRRKQQETPLEREQQQPGWTPRLLEEARLSGSVGSLPSLTRRSQETWLSSKVKCRKTFSNQYNLSICLLIRQVCFWLR